MYMYLNLHSCIPDRLFRFLKILHMLGSNICLKPRSHCPGLRCRFTPVWWSGMNRDEPCHNRGGTVDNLGDPGWTVLNRVKPAHVPGCFKMFKTTGTHRE